MDLLVRLRQSRVVMGCSILVIRSKATRDSLLTLKLVNAIDNVLCPRCPFLYNGYGSLSTNREMCPPTNVSRERSNARRTQC